MATHPQKSILQAVFQRLSGDGTLTALVPAARIGHNLPDSTAYPKIWIGPITLSDWSSHTFDGFQGDIQIHAWTQGQTATPCMDIVNRIYTLLHNYDLAISTFPTLNFRCTLNEVLLEPDGRTYQGIQRYSLLMGGND